MSERTHTKHGYLILQRKPSVNGGEIVAAFMGGGLDPFVIWRMEPDGECHGGSYCASLKRAGIVFDERV